MASTKHRQDPAFLWGALPADVQSSVLGWLPLKTLCRSKAVCKLWNATISAPSFTHFPSRLPRSIHSPWLIFSTPKSLVLFVFDFESRSWFNFDVGFLPSRLTALHASSPASAPPTAQQSFIWCAGSASGLLLLDFCSSLHVCNPLTQYLFKLPPFSTIKVNMALGFSSTHIKGLSTDAEAMKGMPLQAQTNSLSGAEGVMTNTQEGYAVRQGVSMANPTQNNVKQGLPSGTSTGDNAEGADLMTCVYNYTLIVIGKATTTLSIEAYCSDKNSWNVVGSIPLNFIMMHDQMMECNGLFYSLLLNPTGMLVIGENDREDGSIWRVQAIPASCGKETRRLLACQNAIFMVCPVVGFVIWKFQPDSRSWLKMHDMPDYILRDVTSMFCSNWFDCVGVGGFICFRALSSHRVLMYDLSNDSWGWLPEPSNARDTHFTRGFQFEPKLDYRPLL